MMTGGDKGIVEVRFVFVFVFVFAFVSVFVFVFVIQSLVEAREWSDCPNI